MLSAHGGLSRACGGGNGTRLLFLIWQHGIAAGSINEGLDWSIVCFSSSVSPL